MLWVQSGLCFLVWITFGVFQARSGKWSRPKGLQSPLSGALFLIGGALLLGLALWSVSVLGGLKNGALLPWAWLLVVVAGTAFVYAQGLGAATLASAVILSETAKRREASLAKEDPL